MAKDLQNLLSERSSVSLTLTLTCYLLHFTRP